MCGRLRVKNKNRAQGLAHVFGEKVQDPHFFQSPLPNAKPFETVGRFGKA